jgi:cell wall-associated NlpC family hydrolase
MHGRRFSATVWTLTASAVILATASCATITGTGDPTSAIIGGSLKAGTVPAAFVNMILAVGKLCAGLSPALLAAQIEQESSWDPNATSAVGAQGLTQFMPGTWRELGRDANGNGISSPTDPADAIDAQARYMCQLLGESDAHLKAGRIAGDRLDLALAAYNAGMGRVLDAGGNLGQMPAPTQQYVRRIRALMVKYAGVELPPGNIGTGDVAIVRAAASWLGTPYVYGGGELEQPSGIGRDGRGPGWDCSSLTRHAVWIASGRTVEIPRVSSDQARAGTAVPPTLAAMVPGDIIAFSIHGKGIDHVGIYAGNGTMIHAPSTGKNVEQVDLTDNYWSKLPWTVRRFL